MPAGRRLVCCGDGSYTNATILKDLPPDTVYLGRLRKDAALHFLPAAKAPEACGGRPAAYGKAAPTPEALRTDEAVPWEEVEAFAAGRRHRFRVKRLGPVLWRKSGAGRPLQVVVVAPLGYRLRKGARLLYRQPAYLVCTDVQMALEQLLQEYLWRWGIEVNFREEKSLIGVGQAQVRTAPSNRLLPAAIVAGYALLWVSALKLRGAGIALPELRPPKWRRKKPEEKDPLFCTGDLLRALRLEAWGRALRPGSFSHFVAERPAHTKGQKPSAAFPSLPSTLFNSA